MATENPKDIRAIFREGTLVDEALKRAALEAKRQHQRLGLPAAVWRNGKVTWVAADGLDDSSTEPSD